jgi:hypothetical protein
VTRRVPVQLRTSSRTHYLSQRMTWLTLCGHVSSLGGFGGQRFRSPKLATCRRCLSCAKARPQLVLTEETPA